MSADTEVETFLSGVLDEVLVGADTGSLEGFGAQLLILVGDEVDAEREVVDIGTLATEIEDANLGVGDTTVEARLGIRLWSKHVRYHLPKALQSISDSSNDAFFFQAGFDDELPSRHAGTEPRLARCKIDVPLHTYLVLAVSVAAGGTASHFDGIEVLRLVVVGEVLDSRRPRSEKSPSTTF